VTFLIDQGLPSKSALFVPFFGQLAATTPALSMAALRSEAPVLVVMAAREGERLRVMIEGPFPVQRSGDVDQNLLAHTQAVTRAVEQLIRRYPEQWLWLHRRWKYQPPVG
jgi:KDO2-lipid IV(A) lauroyltransferase